MNPPDDAELFDRLARASELANGFRAAMSTVDLPGVDDMREVGRYLLGLGVDLCVRANMALPVRGQQSAPRPGRPVLADRFGGGRCAR